MSSSLLIENGRVITLDDDDRSLRPGWIYVQDDQIEAIGEGDAPRSTTGSDITIDVGGDVVMPGMVNAHTHLFQTFARGTGDDVPLLEWVEKAILPITTHLTADDVRAAATVGLIENVRSGATSVLEHQYVRGDGGVDQAICQAALEVGSRMVLARGWTDIIEFDVYRETIAEFEAGTRDLYEHWDGAEGRITIETGPLVPWGCSDEGMLASRSLAAELGCGIHIHVAETDAEVALGVERNGLRDIEWLSEIGALGPTTQLAHAVWINEHELELIADSGATVVHCPVSNMYLASGVAPIVEMLERDITVALGTDGSGSNNSQDMFESMKTAVLLQKVHRLDATAISPAEVLRMACRGGAAAMGASDRLGTLAEGRLADIVVVDLATAFSTPVHNTYSALVFNASSRDVRTVIVGGRVILRDGQLTTLDEQQALADAIATCKDLFTRAGLQSEVNRP